MSLPFTPQVPGGSYHHQLSLSGGVPLVPYAAGPGDVVTGAKSFWGLRGYNAAYAVGGANPAIDVVKASDGTGTTTIKILVDGTLDVATIAALGYAVKVSKFYDQTGNGFHVTQGTLASMPTLTLNNWGTRPAISAGGLAGTGYASTANSLNLAGVTQRTTGLAYGDILTDGGNNVYINYNTSGQTLGYYFRTGGAGTGNFANGSHRALQMCFQGAGTVIRQDATEQTPGAAVGVNGPGNNISVMSGDATIFWGELGAWSGSQFNATQRGNMQTNIKNYWGTP